MTRDHHHLSTGLSPGSLSSLDDLSDLEDVESVPAKIDQPLDLTVDVDSDIEDGLETGAFLYDEDTDVWGQLEDLENHHGELCWCSAVSILSLTCR